MSNYRTYVCVVGGRLKRMFVPAGLVHSHAQMEAKEILMSPAPYGHWGTLRARFGFTLPRQFYCCSHPMLILGRRAEQAATQTTPEARIVWVKLGARVFRHPEKNASVRFFPRKKLRTPIR